MLTLSEIASKHHKQFLLRHLPTDSVGCIREEKYADVWPTVSNLPRSYYPQVVNAQGTKQVIIIFTAILQVIVTDLSSIPILLSNQCSKNIALILILDCHSAINNDLVTEVFKFD